MISIENLSVSFKDKKILDNINFTLEKGKIRVIFGKNGSGKTVLLKAIAGLVAGYQGKISINGIETGYSKNNSHSIGFVFQKGGLFDSINIFENTAFPLRRLKKDESEIRETVYNTLKRLGLAGTENKFPSELSGGMQKRVGIARAICSNPDIILYDDPTAGLDPVLSDSISDIISDIRNTNKTTSIIATHDINSAKKLADEIGLIYNGQLVFSGSNYEFFNQGNDYTNQFISGDLNGPIDIF